MKKITLLFTALLITMVTFAKKIYLDPWQWSSDNAKFTAWGWKDNSEGSMHTMSYDEISQLYIVELADDINNIIFLRKSPDHNLTNWDCWNQTIDLTIPSDKDKFTINNWNVQDNKSGGEWSTFGNNEGGNDNPDKPATNITDGTQLYLNPNEEWKSDGARFAAYFFGGDGELWVSMTDSNSDGIYEVTCQGTREKIIFCRMNPNTPENIWDNKWNQTSDLTYDGTNNQYNITGWDNSGSWSLFSSSGNDDNNNGDNQGGNNDDEGNIDLNFTSCTLCGNAAIFGSEWNYNNTNNDMTKDADGIWMKTYTDIDLKAGNYEYKIAFDHNFDNGGYPSSRNQTLKITADGIYNLVFTFNPIAANNRLQHTIINTNGNDDNNDDNGNEDNVDVENVTINNIYCKNGSITAKENITIFNITGENVTQLNGNLKNGIYIVKTAKTTIKIIMQ